MPKENQKTQILWLEDQKKYFSDIAKSLKELGVCVVFVETADEFEATLKKQSFDYILIDIRGGEFNGIDVYRHCKGLFGKATCVFLSGWLRERGIQSALTGLKDDVIVLDKVFSSSNSKDLEKTFLAALKSAKEGKSVESNRTYYKEVQNADLDIDYVEFIRLSSLKRAAIRRQVLAKARPKIEEERQAGAVWFLITGPDGEIVESKTTRPEQYDSKMLSHRCLELERPCFIYEVGGGIEEHARAICPDHYSYYFTVDLSFPGSDEIHSVHFDTGAERSWFDEGFLKNCGVGIGLDADHMAELGTMYGPQEFEYWRTRVRVNVFNQNSREQYHFTEVWINGLNGWEETFLGGRAPAGRLCNQCSAKGRCEKRVGLLGQDLLREPFCFALQLDGRTGKTAPIFSKAPVEKKGT